MTDTDIKLLDELLEERKELDYFISGNGKLGVRVNRCFLTKFFGCGTHEIEIKDGETRKAILDILSKRLAEVLKQIEEM